MLESDMIELDTTQGRQRLRLCRARFSRRIQNVLEVLQGHLGFAVNVDDVSEFLKRAENEEGVDEQRKELPDSDGAREDEVHHEQHDPGPHGIYGRTLNETETSEILYLFQFQLQDLVR